MTTVKARSRPENFTITELADRAKDGGLRVPEFQRSFRWEQQDVINLFDSIWRGYPVGNVLLWKKEAPKADVRIGDLKVNAPQMHGALWVVDGQQRITTLVNAVDRNVDESSKFFVVYLPKSDRFASVRNGRGQLSVPVSTLFSIPSLFAWFKENPDSEEYAEQLQGVTSALRDFALSASVLEADEAELKRIFDRVNRSGKPLKKFEVFNAINGASEADSARIDLKTTADSLASRTSFGRLSEDLLYRALLVRRNPDVTRDPNEEFGPERRKRSDFPDEDESTSIRSTEAALFFAIEFLQREVGVPHVSFLPQQFLLLIVLRYFALFPDACRRNRDLLGRWFWRAAANAPSIGITGAYAPVRKHAALIRAGDENGSIRRLLEAASVQGDFVAPDLKTFRTNQASSRIALCAMWARGPRSLETGKPLTQESLVDSLGQSDSAKDVVRRIDAKTDGSARNLVGNRLILDVEDPDLLEWVDAGARIDVQIDSEAGDEESEAADGTDESVDAVLHSHFLTREDLTLLRIDAASVIRRRTSTITEEVNRFLTVRTAKGFEDTPPLESMNLDDF